MITRTRTIIFDDTPIDVRGIRDILKSIPAIEIIGIYDTVGEALRCCKELKPDLIIVDGEIRNDKTVGPTFVRSVLKILPEVKILGLTKWPECIAPLKRAGCKEAVLKQFFDDEQAAQKFIQETLIASPYLFKEEPPELTKDEDRVLRMICNGCTESEIWGKMERSRKQVRTIKESLKDKFGVTSGKDSQLVSHAYRLGYIKPDEDLSEV